LSIPVLTSALILLKLSHPPAKYRQSLEYTTPKYQKKDRNVLSKKIPITLGISCTFFFYYSPKKCV
jgi:hypothetical protein